jgi:hypothetical protein
MSGDNLLHRHLAMTAIASCLYPHPIKLPRGLSELLDSSEEALCRGCATWVFRSWASGLKPVTVWAAIEDLSCSLISYVISIGADMFGRPDGLHRPLRRFACSSLTRRMFTALDESYWLDPLRSYPATMWVCSAMLLG